MQAVSNVSILVLGYSDGLCKLGHRASQVITSVMIEE
jgi:hypothetical protein